MISPKHMEVLRKLSEGWLGPDFVTDELEPGDEVERLLLDLYREELVTWFHRHPPVSVRGCVGTRGVVYLLTEPGAQVLAGWVEANNRI